MPAKVDGLALKLEAMLFAGGTPLSVKELVERSEAPDHRAVQRALRHLSRAYAGRQTCLEIRRVGDRFALQVKEEFLPAVQSVQPVEIAPRTLKVLTLIAYHQPVLQSHLVKMVGETAYEEVQRLRNLGLIRTEPKGATLDLSTTSRFAEYFGIGSSRREEIREFLAKKLGLPVGPAASDGSLRTTGSEPDAPGGPAPKSAPPAE